MHVLEPSSLPTSIRLFLPSYLLSRWMLLLLGGPWMKIINFWKSLDGYYHFLEVSAWMPPHKSEHPEDGLHNFPATNKLELCCAQLLLQLNQKMAG